MVKLERENKLLQYPPKKALQQMHDSLLTQQSGYHKTLPRVKKEVY